MELLMELLTRAVIGCDRLGSGGREGNTKPSWNQDGADGKGAYSTSAGPSTRNAALLRPSPPPLPLHTWGTARGGDSKQGSEEGPRQRTPREIVFYSIGSYYFDLLVNLAPVFQLYKFERCRQ